MSQQKAADGKDNKVEITSSRVENSHNAKRKWWETKAINLRRFESCQGIRVTDKISRKNCPRLTLRKCYYFCLG